MDLYREAMYLLRLLALTTGVGVIFIGIVQGALGERGAGVGSPVGYWDTPLWD